MYTYFIPLAILVTGSFYIVFLLLGVKRQPFAKSIFLSFILIAVESIAPLVGGAFEISVFISTTFAVAAFTLATRKPPTTLKPWQVVAIPVGVSVMGHILVLNACSMTGGTGLVLNSETDTPISGTKVKLKCADKKPHQFKLIKTIETTTNNNGEFTFSTSDVFECEVAFIVLDKENFISTGVLDKRFNNYDNRKIPKVLYMTPKKEENMVRIRYHNDLSYSTSDSAKSSYTYIYYEYISAKFYAKTKREQEYLKTLFCSRLIEKHEKLEDKEREELKKYSAGFPPKIIDHTIYVEPFCKEYNVQNKRGR